MHMEERVIFGEVLVHADLKLVWDAWTTEALILSWSGMHGPQKLG